MRQIKQSTARNIMVLMVLSSDRVTGATSKTLTITASKDGAAFASIAPVVTERGDGWYSIALTAAHTDTLNDLALHITAPACDPVDLLVEVVGYDPGVANPTAAETADAVWDEVLTGATHNIALSAGRRLRQLGGPLIWTGTAQGPGTGSNQIQLDAGASAVDGIYDRTTIALDDGTGAGQSRTILHYVGATRTATVDHDWIVVPDATTTFQVIGNGFVSTVHEGKASAGGASSITFDAHASSVDDIYVLATVSLVSGTGTGQTRRITAYNGTTKVATVDEAWAVNPDSTSGYVVFGDAAKRVDALSTDVITASSVAADAVTEIQTGLATGAAVSAVAADVTSVLGDTVDIQSRLPVALVGGRMDASVGAMAAGVVTAAAVAANAIDADALAADAVTEIQAGLATGASLSAISAKIDSLEAVALGRWEVTGNQLVLYEMDGVTPLATFNLFDDTGTPSMTRIFERVPV